MQKLRKSGFLGHGGNQRYAIQMGGCVDIWLVTIKLWQSAQSIIVSPIVKCSKAHAVWGKSSLHTL